MPCLITRRNITDEERENYNIMEGGNATEHERNRRTLSELQRKNEIFEGSS